jgi:ubiquitin thioesterase protein OTUB1
MSALRSTEDQSKDLPPDAAELECQTQARLEEIESKIKQNPLTSIQRPILDLKLEYNESNESRFLDGVDALSKEYQSFRKVRGDGNCYYRAFLYRLVEEIRQNEKDSEKIIDWLKTKSWESVLAAGYDEVMLEAFHDTIVELLERILAGTLDEAAFHEEMNQETATSDYCTWYLRVVTATHLKQDPGRFLPFIAEPGLGINDFCQREVEPMGKECEQVQVLALAEAFGVQVTIAYLDGHELLYGRLAQHTFGPDSASIEISLLYRPGHYDILYRCR